jgi:Archaeal PaREP1/PaREP8 family.
MVAVILPRRIVEGLGRRGVDPVSYIVDLLVRSLSLDPMVGVEAHLELALGCLEEGRRLADGGPVQASGKLYKAGEEVVRALANYNLDDVLGRVAERGRWVATELSKAALRISDKLGEWFRYSWSSA